MRKTLALSLALVIIAALTACSTITPLVVKGVLIGSAIIEKLRTATGSESDRDALCDYYTAHRSEVEIVREYAKLNWSRIPEEYKPALLAINDQLNACDAATDTSATTAAPKTTARALLDAFKRAVALYRELKAEGVI